MPEIGAVYRLSEADYRFGLGSLLVKVTRVIAPVLFDAETWFHVEARCKYPDSAGEPFDRELYVREAALSK
jgi:hypothetical protein